MGCTDAPLLLVAETMPDILCFVHIANDDETLLHVPGVAEALGGEDYSIETDGNQGEFGSDSENEFEL